MKKSILLGIVALAAGVATSYGQGYVTLDNYTSGANTTPINYSAGIPANGVSGAAGAGGLNSSWVAGLYWVAGNTGLSEAAGSGLPSATLAPAVGAGSTVAFDTQNALANPGFYGSQSSFNTGSTLNTTITLEVCVWDAADPTYAAAHYRGHSAAFSMGTVAITSPTPIYTGDFMPGTITVLAVVPEPTTMALGGLGLAALVLARRKKA